MLGYVRGVVCVYANCIRLKHVLAKFSSSVFNDFFYMALNPTVLVIDDDTEIRYSLERVLAARNYRVLLAGSGEEGVEVASKEMPEVILLDIRMGGMSGLEALQHIRSESPRSMVILMTAFGTTQTAIEAMKFGAYDYIMKPFDLKKILGLIDAAAESCEDMRGAEQEDYEPLLNSEDYQEGIVGNSEPMQEVFKIVGQVAGSDVTVMITGESGTGKELVARCIYQHSHRAEQNFMAVNCAAIPENLIESELFGHEKGSFTGATNQRIGKFELCDNGTIFLDEIGDMPLHMQTKILRVLQEGEIQRVGGTSTLKVDVRIIAATNKNLEEMVKEGTFREDLYYRLNVVRLRLPSLRERREDIPHLVDFMLQRLAKDRKTHARKISPEALAVLVSYPWTGNVRELENVIYRSAVVAKGDTILAKDLPSEMQNGSGDSEVSAPHAEVRSEASAAPVSESPVPKVSDALDPPAASAASEHLQELIGDPVLAEKRLAAITLEDACDLVYERIRSRHDKLLLQVMEEEIITRALRECEGNQVKTSALLGITRATLRKRIEQFDIRST